MGIAAMTTIPLIYTYPPSFLKMFAQCSRFTKMKNASTANRILILNTFTWPCSRSGDSSNYGSQAFEM